MCPGMVRGPGRGLGGRGPCSDIRPRSFSANSGLRALQGEQSAYTIVAGLQRYHEYANFKAHSHPMKGCRHERMVSTISWVTPVRSEPELTGARGLGARLARNWTHSDMNNSYRGKIRWRKMEGERREGGREGGQGGREGGREGKRNEEDD